MKNDGVICLLSGMPQLIQMIPEDPDLAAVPAVTLIVILRNTGTKGVYFSGTFYVFDVKKINSGPYTDALLDPSDARLDPCIKGGCLCLAETGSDFFFANFAAHQEK